MFMMYPGGFGGVAMKYGLVVTLFLGICGLAVGEVATCASFFNPLVSSFKSVPSCYVLRVEGEPAGISAGIVSSSDVVKTQGPNKGETCLRFIFVVRDGLGIRRARVGLWNQEIPLSNARFTRKRKFLDTEPTTVRVDACLDDIQTEADCCTGEQTTFLVAEAKVRMENGKVATATLSDKGFIGEMNCGSGPTPPPPPNCFRGNSVNGDEFLQCEFKVDCDDFDG
mmetsp:Transcript_21246/g.30876  ORF Transcript_21246/g.30876 Transcript_21246/m.30876 type:complete len:225 (-) Transcript_21246:300-974(-)